VHESQDQADLLPVAFGQFPGGAVQHGAEPLGEHHRGRQVPQAPGSGVPVEVLTPGHSRIEREVSGQVPGPAVDLDAVPRAVQSQDRRAAAVRPLQGEQHPDGRGLSGSVGAEEREHLAGLDQ
jgi:hypothetical protein